MKVFSILIPGLILIAVPPLAAANWWIETTGEDFTDGEYTASLYAADTGVAGDGAVQMIHWRDIDKDGNLDLVISNNRSRDTLDPGPAYHAYHYDNRAFVDSLFSYNGSGNLIVDYDNDGNLDIVLSAYDDALGATNINSRVYYGPGFDSASAKTFLTDQAMAVSAADLDKDGDLDLLFSNYAGGNASIYYQGTATPQNLACANNCGNAIADMDKDGNPDIVLAGLQAIIYYGPDFTSNDVIAGIDSLTDVTAADLDGDDALDLVFSAWGDSAYIVFGPDYTTVLELSTTESRGVSVADLNRDDELDIVFSNLAPPGSIYYGPDYGMIPSEPLMTHASMGNIIGDFDGNRTLDICFCNWAEDDTFDTYSYIYLGPDLTFYDSVLTHGAHISTTTDAGNPYDRSGTEIYVSSIFDAVDSVEWDSVLYTTVIPFGSGFILEVQTGNVPDPDTSWSEWLQVASGDTLPDSLASRYIRYRGTFTTDFLQAPRLEEVAISYPSEGDVAPENIISPLPEDVTRCDTRILIVQVRNLGNAAETFPVHCLLDSLGINRFDSTLMAVDVAPGDSAILIFGGMYCCPGETLWVITEFADDTFPGNDTLFAHLGPVAIQERTQRYELEFEVSPASQGFSVDYTLPANERIAIACYDVTGRTVKVLDEGMQRAGRHSLAWDGRDSKGQLVSAGIYFVRLETQTKTLTRKIVVVD
ncbi:T9SS type A sorting domain-containing protein [candidate division WOR-3 bacterium]|nr:T9SS type A sorting domain-containing protein [candidate division WOR-3 bacterium]